MSGYSLSEINSTTSPKSAPKELKGSSAPAANIWFPPLKIVLCPALARTAAMFEVYALLANAVVALRFLKRMPNGKWNECRTVL